jgi:archaellum component FlaC
VPVQNPNISNTLTSINEEAKKEENGVNKEERPSIKYINNFIREIDNQLEKLNAGVILRTKSYKKRFLLATDIYET